MAPLYTNYNKQRRATTSKSQILHQLRQDGCSDEHACSAANKIIEMSERSVHGISTRKRGHQHHPRYNGTRRRFTTTPQKQVTTQLTDNLQNLTDTTITTNDRPCNDSTPNNNNPVIDLTEDDQDNNNLCKAESILSFSHIDDEDMCISKVARPAAEGSSQSDNEVEDQDPEIEELASLRCTSERTEVIAERETRRRRRCADYPGLAFGRSIFSSDTMMKFSIIRNELHNIMNSQLKRVCFLSYDYCKQFKWTASDIFVSDSYVVYVCVNAYVLTISVAELLIFFNF